MSISITRLVLSAFVFGFAIAFMAYTIGYRRGRRSLEAMLRRAGSRLAGGGGL